MAFCINCGSALPEAAKFCPACGVQAVSPEAPEEAEDDTPPEQILTEEQYVNGLMDGSIRCLDEIPRQMRTYAVFLAFFTSRNTPYSKDIEIVPEDLYDEQLFVQYAKSDNSVFKRFDSDKVVVPEKFRTQKFWHARIMSLSNSDQELIVKEFSLVPKDMLSKEWWFIAVKKCGALLQVAPKEYITYELCLAAIDFDDFRRPSLCFVPEQFKTYNLCIAAVSHMGENLEFVPEAIKDKYLCWAAVYSTIKAFRFMPDQYKTERICLAAVADDYYANKVNLKYVPEAFKTEKLCMLAAGLYHTERRGFSCNDDKDCLLQYIPPEFRSRSMCLSAMGRNTEIWKHIPPEVINMDFCIKAVSKTTAHYDFIPQKFRTNQKILDMYQKEHKHG